WLDDAGADRPSRPSPRPRRGPAAFRGARAVTPMVRRLLRLLMVHPTLAMQVGDQQLELLAQHPHLLLVRQLVALQGSSGATHTGALLEAADPESELSQVLQELSAELLSVDWPDPQAEWRDALLVIEQQTIQEQCDRLVAQGLHTPQDQSRYRELSQ